MILALPLGLAIGMVVGSVGGGGAILALPALVYVLDEPLSPATTASLIVVAVAAASGTMATLRSRLVCWPIALSFAAPAAAGALLGAVLNGEVAQATLVLAFVPVMLAAATAAWVRAGRGAPDEADRPCPDVAPGAAGTAGLMVGVLTGFFGVGGGFLIVPVLTVWFGLPIRRAIATSLVIITLTGVAALASHLAIGAAMDVPVTVLMALATAVGAAVGARASAHLPQRALGRGFALVVAAVAIGLTIDTLLLDGPAAG